MEGVNSGVIGGIISVVLLGILAPVVQKILFQWNSRKHDGYDRVLNAKETAWVSSYARRLSEEKSNQKYPFWTILLWSGTLPVIVGMGTIFGFIYLIHKALLKPINPSAYSWLRVDFGVSFVLSIFLGIFIAAIAMIISSRISTTFRDYLTYNYGWGYMSPKARGEREIREELEHQIRKGDLTHEDEYDSDYFSTLIFERTSPTWKKWTIGVFCLTAFFLVLDTQYSIDIYEDKIKISPYFSIFTHSYQFKDIESISRECTLGKSDGLEHAYLSYNLHMTDRREINLFSLNGIGDTPHLDTIEGILPSLEDVKFKPTIVDTAPVIKLEPTQELCLKFIEQTNGRDETKRIISLFEL